MTATLSSRVGRAFYGTRSGLRQAQQEAISVLLAGEDLLVVAGTGSGKTEAVIAPLVDRLLAAGSTGTGPVILYVAPTRALVNDLRLRLETPLDALGLRVGARHAERNDLDRVAKPDLLITTLESYDSVLTTNPRALDQVKAVVVDEVHHVGGTQRGLQLAHVIARHSARTGRPLQVAGMSATVDDPTALWQRLRPGRPVSVLQVGDQRTRRYVLARTQTPDDLVALLEKTYSATKVMCFAGSRSRSEEVAHLASQTKFGDRVMVHHSSLSAAERLLVEEQFKQPAPSFVAATSTLELGIDVGDVGLVVLCGPPTDWRSFSQRIGRANRRGDEVRVLCVVPPWSKAPVRDAAAFLALARQLEERELTPGGSGPLFGATAQQLVNQLRQVGTDQWQTDQDLGDALGTVDEAPLAEILDELAEAGIVARHPSKRSMWAAGPAVGSLHNTGDLWGNFPVGSRVLRIVRAGKSIGEVPGTNGSQLVPGASFRLQGRSWRVERRSRDEVHVVQHRGAAAVELAFGGSKLQLDPAVVRDLPGALTGPLPPGVQVALPSSAWWEQISSHLSTALRTGGLPRWRTGEGVVLCTWAGGPLNRAVLHLLGVEGQADDTAIYSDLPLNLARLPVDAEAWCDAVAASVEAPAELTTWQGRLPPHLLRREQVEAVLTSPGTRAAIVRLTTSPVYDCEDGRLSALLPG